MDRLLGSVTIGHLLAFPFTIHFRPQTKCGPDCGRLLTVLKTIPDRTLYTLHAGAFNAHETVLGCKPCGNQAYRAEELKRLVPERGSYGYDVIVQIGQSIFLDNRPIAIVKAEMTARRIPISKSEIHYLAAKFIVYLSIAHQRAAERLKDMIMMKGGYILHIDATCDKGSPFLLSCIDSISRLVLWNTKIPSERSEYITPLLRKIKEMFGSPLAAVMDMGNGMEKAVKEVFDDVKMLICHFHFLRDIGKDLLEEHYHVIRKRLKHYGITSKLNGRARTYKLVVDANLHLVKAFASTPVTTDKLNPEDLQSMPAVIVYTIIQWIFMAKKIGGGYGFPFDRSHLEFVSRLQQAYLWLRELEPMFSKNKPKYNRPITKVCVVIESLLDDKILKEAITCLKQKISIFDELRKAMRLASTTGTKGLNDNGDDIPIELIERRVHQFRKKYAASLEKGEDQAISKMITQIDKYSERLFADPITVQTTAGEITIQPQRTNNLMEHFFRDVKRGYRHKTGHNAVGKIIRAMNPNTPLVKNLSNSQYREILLNGKDTLEEVFADIEASEVYREMEAVAIGVDKVPSEVKILIKQDSSLHNYVKTLKHVLT